MKRILPIAISFALLIGLAAQSLDVQLQRAVQKEAATGDLKAAINEYKRIAGRAGKDRALAATALLRLAEAQQKLGDAEANKVYQQIVREYSDQAAAATARTRVSNAGGRAAAGVANRLVWTLPQNASSIGRVSPDGRYVAFASRSDLMVRELVTGMERTVAHFNQGSPGMTMAWSPDGRRLAFEASDSSGVEIRSINADGSGMRTAMSSIQGWARVLDFFPDGNRVLCLRNQNGDSLLFWININDGSMQDLVLRPGPGGAGWPRLSPDGRYVALRNSPGLSLLATDGLGETVISRNGGDLNAAGWSADGSRLLFIRQQNDRTDLWAAPIADGKPNGLASLVYRDYGSVSVIENQVTRGGSLYYTKSSLFSNGGEVYTASVDFAAGKLLTEPLPEFSRGPGIARWSQDGTYLAYAPNNSAPPALLVRSAETAQTRDVRPKLKSMNTVNGIDWHPDGLRFAVMGIDPADRQGIYWVDAQTGDVQPIVSAPPGMRYENQRLSPDGRTLYYSRVTVPLEAAVVERDLASGRERVLLEESALRGKHFHPFRPSPDGRYLAYALDDAAGHVSIYIRTAGEGDTREVPVTSSEVSHCSPLDWTRDSGAILYDCVVRPGGIASVSGTWILPLADLKPRKLDLGFPSPVGISVHPDARRIAISVSRPPTTELHVLENFLPPVK